MIVRIRETKVSAGEVIVYFDSEAGSAVGVWKGSSSPQLETPTDVEFELENEWMELAAVGDEGIFRREADLASIHGIVEHVWSDNAVAVRCRSALILVQTDATIQQGTRVCLCGTLHLFPTDV